MKANVLGVKQPNAVKGANIWPAGLGYANKSNMGIEVTPALAKNVAKAPNTIFEKMNTAPVTGNTIWSAGPTQRKSRKATKAGKGKKTRRTNRRAGRR